MKSKLIWALLISVIYGITGTAVILWGLPGLGIQLPLYWLIIVFLALAVFSVVSFKVRHQIFLKEPIAGLSSMVGTTGRVITRLTPNGMVKIKGELWEASAAEEIASGERVIVVAHDDLKLTVRRLQAKS